MSVTYQPTKEEKETQILYNQTNEPINISGFDTKLLRQLAAYSRRHPDLCRRIERNGYPEYDEYEIQKDRVSIRLLEPLSEERKKAAAEQAKRMNENRKS